MKTKRILNMLNVISWIIFIGLCIKTGAIIFSFLKSLFVNNRAAESLFLYIDLSYLYNYSLSHYIAIVCFIILINFIKAYLFYLVIKAFKVLDYDNPFSKRVSIIVSKISYFSLYVGVIALIANGYSIWLLKQSVFVPFNWGTSELIFMAGVIFIISYLFKRATQIQEENDLTI